MEPLTIFGALVVVALGFAVGRDVVKARESRRELERLEARSRELWARMREEAQAPQVSSQRVDPWAALAEMAEIQAGISRLTAGVQGGGWGPRQKAPKGAAARAVGRHNRVRRLSQQQVEESLRRSQYEAGFDPFSAQHFSAKDDAAEADD